MNTAEILSAMKVERDRLSRAINVLEGPSDELAQLPSAARRTPTRMVSAATRRKIAEAQRERWARSKEQPRRRTVRRRAAAQPDTVPVLPEAEITH